MPFYDCPECGNSVPVTASACPMCGHPNSPVDTDVPGSSEPRGVDLKTGENLALDQAEPQRRDGWSRLPTWLLFVLVFVFGSVILVAGVFAVVVLGGAMLGELGDSGDAVDTTVAAATTVPVASEDGLAVGECLDSDELDKYLAGEEFAATPCSDPHDLEVYYVYEFPAGPYPGDDAVIDELRTVCRGEFEGYVGLDYASSSLDFWVLWPNQGLWESGNRTGECAVYDVDSNKLTGSAYQSGW